MQIWSAGYRVRSIKPLEEDVALKDGAEFVGESFVFLVSGTFVVWEYRRSADAAHQKEEQIRAKATAERDALQAKLIALDARLKALEEVVKHNQRSILGLGGRPYVEPDAGKLVEIDDEQSHSQEGKEEAIQSDQPSLTKPWWKYW
jgi:Optic atrophy 3 protein (OPA3)